MSLELVYYLLFYFFFQVTYIPFYDNLEGPDQVLRCVASGDFANVIFVNILFTKC